MAATPKKMMQLNFTDICCTTDHLGLGQWKYATVSKIIVHTYLTITALGIDLQPPPPDLRIDWTTTCGWHS
jgi:hypothetical protein